MRKLCEFIAALALVLIVTGCGGHGGRHIGVNKITLSTNRGY